MPVEAITVLMTTWNGAPYIGPAVESVLAQTYADWRLLVIDDASTDDTAAIVRGFSDERISVVPLEQNVGQTGALNIGLAQIETPWVARLDQDDLAAPTRLERQLAYVHEHPRTVLAGSWASYIDEAGEPIGAFQPPTSPDEVRRALFRRLDHNPLAHSAVIYRRDAVHAAGGYRTDLSLAQDTALWAKLATQGDIANVGEVLVSIRQHPGQASRSANAAARQLDEAMIATERLPAWLALSASDTRLWRRGQARGHAHLAIHALRTRQPSEARRHLRGILGQTARAPSAALDVLSVVGEGVRYRLGRERERLSA